jgi:ABC-type branched-subunit amino acid transport system substrate-binding protein
VKRREIIAAAAALCTTRTTLAGTRATLGVVLPLSGQQEAVGAELLQGYQLAAGEQDADITLAVEDDKSDGALAVAIARRMATDPRVLALSGIVGTPTAAAVLPETRARGLPVVGLRSGAQELRDGGPLVYHLRAGYDEELAHLAGALRAVHTSIAVLASADTFGRPALRVFREAAARRGVQVVASREVPRKGDGIEEATLAVLDPTHGPTALVLLHITPVAIAAAREARRHGFMGPIFMMSFIAPREVVRAGPGVYRGVGMLTAFPVPRIGLDAVSASFRREASRAGKHELLDSVTAAEGYLYCTAFKQAVSAGASREALVGAMENRAGLRLGDQLLRFGPARSARAYLQPVYFDHTGRLRA